jgi:hypothetical protein
VSSKMVLVMCTLYKNGPVLWIMHIQWHKVYSIGWNSPQISQFIYNTQFSSNVFPILSHKFSAKWKTTN